MVTARDAVDTVRSPTSDVQRQRARRRGRAAQHRPHPQRQFARAERLGQVVVGAGLQPRDPVVLLAERGQQDHRNRVVAALSQAAAQGQAVRAGHHHVEHRDVDALRAEKSQCLGAVVRDRDFQAVALQIAAHDVAHDGVVVGDQYPRHTPRLAAYGHDLR